MTHKKLLTPTTLTTLLIFVLAFVFAQFWGTPFRELMNGITVLAIYGVLTLSYLLYIALIFVGLFALYRVLWARVNDQNYTQAEV